MKLLQWVLAGLLLLVTVQSSWFFLAKKQVSVIMWICFNACALVNLTFLIGFAGYAITGRMTMMYAAILPLFFFGTGGLLVFTWRGPFIMAQISHVIMTLNLTLTVYLMFHRQDFRHGVVGLLAGSLVFALFIGFQQQYVHRNREVFQSLMTVGGRNDGKKSHEKV